MSKSLLALTTFFLLLAVNACLMATRLRESGRIISEIEIENVDLSDLVDAVYYGTKDAVTVSAEVWVTIKDTAITDIKLIHKHGRGEKAERIIDTVKEKQSLEVDMITDETSSSKVILKAIENALKSKPIKLPD